MAWYNVLTQYADNAHVYNVNTPTNHMICMHINGLWSPDHITTTNQATKTLLSLPKCITRVNSLTIIPRTDLFVHIKLIT